MASQASLPEFSADHDILRDLLARVGRGDQGAFAELYDLTAAHLYGFVRRILNNPGVAEEVALDVYSQVWRQAARYDGARSAPMTWLVMLARSRAIDSLRSRRKETLDDSIRAASPLVDPAPTVEETLTANVRQKIVRSALAALDKAQKEAIELSFFGGLSHSAIAEKLGQPVGTIKSRIRLGMQHLRNRLQQNGDIF